MHVKNSPESCRKKWSWKRWGVWAFVVFNVVGIIVAWPLIQAIAPLAGIWWETHSQASFQRHQRKVGQPPQMTLAMERTGSPRPASLPLSVTNSALPDTNTDSALQELGKKVKVVDKLSDTDINQIIAWKFGQMKKPKGDPTKFDANSAVFDKITRTVIDYEGKPYYAYEVDLVDQNGNHKVNVDCFSEPNLEYERSKATMELVNKTPQLKRIYDAFAYVLAEKSSPNTNAPPDTNSPQPALRFEQPSQ